MNDSARSEGSEPTQARALLRKHGIRPKKRLGQNFLIDANTLDKIVEAARLLGSERVLEVGAGLGALTVRLAGATCQVFAVEYDRRLEPILAKTLADVPNVQLRFGDILEMDLTSFTEEGPYQVVANIPYNITSALIRRLLEAVQPPERMALTVQKEVAERIVVGAGEMNLLALSVQIYGRPEIAFEIPAEVFYPTPDVDSALLFVRMHDERRLASELIERFFVIARAGFGQKRKMLRNALSARLRLPKGVVEDWLQGAGISPRRRAQELDLETWLRLTEQSPELPNSEP
jgi:16S rRNA (adenine1518-N6/adenine1519-N6)-dimethyltransferase